MAAIVMRFQPPSSSRVRSIQGEREAREQPALADEGDVDQYVQRADERVLDCRQRGHSFPPSRRNVMDFTDVDESGLLIRRVRCGCCNLADRVEKWDVRERRGVVTRCVLVSATIHYRTDLDGRTYLAPSGQGRMTRRLVRNSVVTSAFAGQDARQLRASLANKEG